MYWLTISDGQSTSSAQQRSSSNCSWLEKNPFVLIAKPVCPHVMKNHSFHTAAAESGPSFSEKLTNLDVRFYRESGHSAKIALKGR
jgi:hypothetical protein